MEKSNEFKEKEHEFKELGASVFLTTKRINLYVKYVN